MTENSGEIVARARACGGARFKPQGRDPTFGLDCVGLAGRAFGVQVPSGYTLRGGDPADLAARITAAGLMPVPSETAGPGDLVLIDAGHRQLHLAVLTDVGFVHAHAGLRRVVETPERPEGVIGAWRARTE